MLTIETIIRLERPSMQLLSTKQFLELYQNHIKSIPMELDTKQFRFIQHVYNVLSSEFHGSCQLMYLFPFSKFPFVVLLNKELTRKISNDPPTDLPLNGHPFQLAHLLPNYFKNCTAFLLLLKRDFTHCTNNSMVGNLRAQAYLCKRLLERLGFRVVLAAQRDYIPFVMPSRMVDVNSDEYRQSAKSILKAVKTGGRI